jgi:hypothetical protein
MLSLQLQKSPTPDFEEKCGNSPDISKGISQMGMCKFESSKVSQAFPRPEVPPLKEEKSSPTAGLCYPADCLQTPKFTKSEADLPKVSGPHREYSLFFGRLSPETGFETHCVALAAVRFGIFSNSGAIALGAVSHVLPSDRGSRSGRLFLA